MKRLLKIFLFISICFMSLTLTSYAEDNDSDAYEIYGLLSVSKLMSFDEDFNFDNTVDSKSYADIMTFYFGEIPEIYNAPTNSDAISDLARLAPKVSESKYKLSSYKDFGFIKKEHRKAYNIMCSAGYLEGVGDMLRPNTALKYGYFFSLLKHFEDYAAINNNFEINSGVITDAYADKNDIIIKQNSDNGIKEYSFNKMHSFYVCSDRKITPYSYNLKRGQNAKIYTADGTLIYACITEGEDKLNGHAELGEAYIYICNEFDNELVFKNKLTGSYMKLPFDNDILVYEGSKRHPVSEINNTLLDRNCYYITDSISGKIKYINISG